MKLGLKIKTLIFILISLPYRGYATTEDDCKHILRLQQKTSRLTENGFTQIQNSQFLKSRMFVLETDSLGRTIVWKITPMLGPFAIVKKDIDQKPVLGHPRKPEDDDSNVNFTIIKTQESWDFEVSRQEYDNLMKMEIPNMLRLAGFEEVEDLPHFFKAHIGNEFFLAIIIPGQPPLLASRNVFGSSQMERFVSQFEILGTKEGRRGQENLSLGNQSIQLEINPMGAISNVVFTKDQDIETVNRGLEHPLPGFDLPPVLPDFTQYQNNTNDIFQIGKVNPQDAIGSLKKINDTPLDQIAASLKAKGFLHPHVPLGDTSLLTILLNDNETVLNSGWTHQELAFPLLQFTRLFLAGLYDPYQQPFQITFHDQVYLARINRTAQTYQSPFGDNQEYPQSVITITNQQTNESIVFHIFLPQMIYLYGFYGGPVQAREDSSARIEPSKIIEFFHLQKKP